MELRFIKNLHFTRLVNTQGRLREFNFRQMRQKDEIRFSVDVVDDRGNRLMFLMKKDHDQWKIDTPRLPDWVLKKETTFHQLIEEALH